MLTINIPFNLKLMIMSAKWVIKTVLIFLNIKVSKAIRTVRVI